MATGHMEQKHGVSLAPSGQPRWPISAFKMSPHSNFNTGSSAPLNIKKEATEVMTARVPPSYRSDPPAVTKMAAISPMNRSASNPLPESPKSNDSNSGSSKPLIMKKTGFGQSLAKHIEAAISRELIGNKSPTMSDLMFMKSSSGEEDAEEGIRKPAAADDKSNPLSLMSLLDKVVEESLRNVPIGKKPEKPDLKFMVSFSDDEDDAAKKTKSKEFKRSGGEQSPNSTAKDEAVVSSSESTTTKTTEARKDPQTQPSNR